MEPRTRKLMEDLFGVVTEHLGHPLSWLPSSCKFQDTETPRAAVIYDTLLPVSSTVHQRISKGNMGREWEEGNSMGRGATFVIREEEAEKNGTGVGWTFPHHPTQRPPTPTLKSQKSHGKTHALSVLYIPVTDTQGSSLFFSLYISIICLPIFRGKELKWLEKKGTPATLHKRSIKEVKRK